MARGCWADGWVAGVAGPSEAAEGEHVGSSAPLPSRQLGDTNTRQRPPGALSAGTFPAVSPTSRAFSLPLAASPYCVLRVSRQLVITCNQVPSPAGFKARGQRSEAPASPARMRPPFCLPRAGRAGQGGPAPHPQAPKQWAWPRGDLREEGSGPGGCAHACPSKSEEAVCTSFLTGGGLDPERPREGGRRRMSPRPVRPHLGSPPPLTPQLFNWFKPFP